MAYSGDSSPLGGASAVPQAWQDAIARTNSADAPEIVRCYQAFAPQAGLNADLALAQSALETGWFDSPAWRTRRNPAGLGITADNVAGPDFKSVEGGVKAHLDLLRCYFVSATPVWGVLASVGFGGFFLGKTTLSGMNGVWAVPGTGYGQHIADIANSVVGGAAPGGAPGAAGVYGEDIVAALIPHIGEANSDGTLDPWNGPHPWPGYCESLTEGGQYAAGLRDVVHRASAAVKLDAVTAQGLLQQSWPPEDGGICLWGRDFDPQGHTTVWSAAKQMWISTLYPPHPGVDYFHSDAWQAAMRGWYRAPGVVAANRAQPLPTPPAPQTPFFIDGNPYGPVPLRDIFWARGVALNTLGAKMDHPGAVNPHGLALPTLGYAMQPETTLPSGRRVQRFERGWLATQGAAEPFNVVVLLAGETPK